MAELVPSRGVVRRPNRLRNERGGRFRILVGIHFDKGPPGCTCNGCANDFAPGSNHKYVEGDVLESKADLDRRLNQGPYSRKVERVPDDTPLSTDQGDYEPETPAMPSEAAIDLERMDVTQLRELATANGIELGGEQTKKAIVRILKTALEV